VRSSSREWGRSRTCSWRASAEAPTRWVSSTRSSTIPSRRSDEPGDHAARFLGRGGALGILQGTRTYVLQDDAGNVLPTHSVSAGLDYPAVGPEHAQLRDRGRVEYASVRDGEALEAFSLLSRTEGLIPALESAHAVAWVVRESTRLRGQSVLVSLSGRGDKDLGIVEGLGLTSQRGGAA